MNNQVMPNFIKKRAFLTPDRPAIQYDHTSYTFSEVYERSYQIAGQLTTKDLNKGQYVGVLLNNHVDTVFILLALQLLGIKAVILNNRLTVNELSWQMNDSQSQFLITEKDFDAVIVELNHSMPHVASITKEELLESEHREPAIVEELSLDEVCTVMYTSGTTGHPKGVLQTYGNHWWSAVGSALNLGLNEKDCWLCTVPLFHISGYSILMRSIIYGIKIVLFESFNIEKVVEVIRTEKVTIMSAVSTMLSQLVEELGENKLPNHFRCMLLGGGPASKTLLEACTSKYIPVYQTYGMTETSSQIVTLSPEYSLSKLGSAGKALFPSQLKIVDERGEESKQSEPGEIVVKGPNVTRGYLNQNPIEGWLSTGDIGYMDKDGFLYVLDRRSDLIISGGENIYPAEIEGILCSHPAISDAGVIGVKDQLWGEVPVAFVTLNTEAQVSEVEIVDYCLRKLAKYKVPKRVCFIDQIPRNAAKKIVRRELRNHLPGGGEPR